MNIRDPIVEPYSTIHCHWKNISGKCVLGKSKSSVHQHSPWHCDYHLDYALWWSILMWGDRLTKSYLVWLLQHLLNKLWCIEYPIISVACPLLLHLISSDLWWDHLEIFTPRFFNLGSKTYIGKLQTWNLFKVSDNVSNLDLEHI